MLRVSAVIACLCAITLENQRLLADEPPRQGYEVETHLDLAYRNDKDADPIRHKLDIYTPKGQKEFPVMIFVHGGTWKSGNKSLYAGLRGLGGLGDTFAKQGIGTVIINYRLSGKDSTVKHPDHIQDVASAFAWVHANIGKYGGRNDRIFLSGHSAGGHLVALLATDDSYLKAHQLGLKNIRGVMALSGVYEIAPKFAPFDDVFGKDATVRSAASPLSHVTAKDPPFLICYADKDFLTIDKMSEDMCLKLKNCQCDASVLKIENRTHLSIIIRLALDSDDPCTRAMFDFIAKHSEWKLPGK